MNLIQTFKDERGVFIPYSYKHNDGIWDQMNISINTKKYTFRGMHYQTHPPQLKQVKVIQGRAIDFLYNLKTHEVKTYELDLNNDLLVDPKYAHGFLTLEDNTIFTYKVSTEYNPNSEHSIVWDTIPEIKKIINDIVGGNKLTISKKDKIGK